MAFDPEVGGIVTIHGSQYIFLRNEATAKELRLVDAREGGEGIVYRVASFDAPSQYWALKTFHNNLEPYFAKLIADSTQRLLKFKDLPGLKVCDRKLVKSFSDCPESRQHPELKNAALMPWVVGYTWHDIIASHLNGQAIVNLDKPKCFTLGFATAKILTSLEANKLAHCDIASGNIIFDLKTTSIELIDVEDMYFPGAAKPTVKPLGSKGYKHPATKQGIWFAEGDRFAGAVLICEMLTWHSPEIKNCVNDDTFFSNEELGQYCEKYEMVRKVLSTYYSNEFANLFDEAWFSDSIASCPKLQTWYDGLSQYGQSQRAILQVAPLYLDFGTIDSQKVMSLSISNTGKETLRGSIVESDTSWLSLRQRVFELQSGDSFNLEIKANSPTNLPTEALLVSNLTVDSNGGQANVTVAGKVGSNPLPSPPTSDVWPIIAVFLVVAGVIIGLILLSALCAALSNYGTVPSLTPATSPTELYMIFPTLTAITLPSSTNNPVNMIHLTKTRSPSPTATTLKIIPTLTKKASPVPPIGDICSGAPRIRIAINDLVKVVTTNNDRLILRSEPKTTGSTEKKRLNYGTLLKIHDGPVCVHDSSKGKSYWFWEVKVKGSNVMGWVAEGDTSMYYIEKVR